MKEYKIDWEEQWRLFAPHYSEGFAKIDLEGQESFVLVPGEGFGDLSHPTTRLTLRFLTGRVKDKFVIDMGCGSGILSIAAHFLGARKVVGLDIDEMALIHAKKNAECNGLRDKINFFNILPSMSREESPFLIVMNMIFVEQRQAWDGSILAKLVITSGILKTQREEYLCWAKQWGWNLIEEKEEGEWLAFLFQT